MKIQNLLFALLVGLALIIGCKKDDNPVTPPSGSPAVALVGTIAGSNSSGGTQSGVLTLAIPAGKPSAIASDTLNISGQIVLSTGDTITLSGYYIKTTGYLYVTGEGFTLYGTLVGGHLTNTHYDDGAGGHSGTVAASASSSSNTVTVFCGTYTELSPGTETGTFNLLLQGSSITIVTSKGFTFYGTLSGTSVTVYIEGTSGTVLATGTLEGTHASGTYDTPDPKHGSWVADVCH